MSGQCECEQIIKLHEEFKSLTLVSDAKKHAHVDDIAKWDTIMEKERLLYWSMRKNADKFNDEAKVRILYDLHRFGRDFAELVRVYRDFKSIKTWQNKHSDQASKLRSDAKTKDLYRKRVEHYPVVRFLTAYNQYIRTRIQYLEQMGLYLSMSQHVKHSQIGGNEKALSIPMVQAATPLQVVKQSRTWGQYIFGLNSGDASNEDLDDSETPASMSTGRRGVGVIMKSFLGTALILGGAYAVSQGRTMNDTAIRAGNALRGLQDSAIANVRNSVNALRISAGDAFHSWQRNAYANYIANEIEAGRSVAAQNSWLYGPYEDGFRQYMENLYQARDPKTRAMCDGDIRSMPVRTVDVHAIKAMCMQKQYSEDFQMAFNDFWAKTTPKVNLCLEGDQCVIIRESDLPKGSELIDKTFPPDARFYTTSAPSLGSGDEGDEGDEEGEEGEYVSRNWDKILQPHKTYRAPATQISQTDPQSIPSGNPVQSDNTGQSDKPVQPESATSSQQTSDNTGQSGKPAQAPATQSSPDSTSSPQTPPKSLEIDWKAIWNKIATHTNALGKEASIGASTVLRQVAKGLAQIKTGVVTIAKNTPNLIPVMWKSSVSDTVIYDDLKISLNRQFGKKHPIAVKIVLKALENALIGKGKCGKHKKATMTVGYSPVSLVIAGPLTPELKSMIMMIVDALRSRVLIDSAVGEGSFVDRVTEFAGNLGTEAGLVLVPNAVDQGDGIYNLEAVIDKGRCFNRPIITILVANFVPEDTASITSMGAMTGSVKKAAVPAFGGRHALVGRIQFAALMNAKDLAQSDTSHLSFGESMQVQEQHKQQDGRSIFSVPWDYVPQPSSQLSSNKAQRIRWDNDTSVLVIGPNGEKSHRNLSDITDMLKTDSDEPTREEHRPFGNKTTVLVCQEQYVNVVIAWIYDKHKDRSKIYDMKDTVNDDVENYKQALACTKDIESNATETDAKTDVVPILIFDYEKYNAVHQLEQFAIPFYDIKQSYIKQSYIILLADNRADLKERLNEDRFTAASRAVGASTEIVFTPTPLTSKPLTHQSFSTSKVLVHFTDAKTNDTAPLMNKDIVTQSSGRTVLMGSDPRVKTLLSNPYDLDHPVLIVCGTDTPKDNLNRIHHFKFQHPNRIQLPSLDNGRKYLLNGNTLEVQKCQWMESIQSGIESKLFLGAEKVQMIEKLSSCNPESDSEIVLAFPSFRIQDVKNDPRWTSSQFMIGIHVHARTQKRSVVFGAAICDYARRHPKSAWTGCVVEIHSESEALQVYQVMCNVMKKRPNSVFANDYYVNQN